MSSNECMSVREFYRDRSIFITGGTGFMGKVLVEKLLRSCSGIKNIYLLMRPKRGQGVQQRLQELLDGPVTIFPPLLCIVYSLCLVELRFAFLSTAVWKVTAGFPERALEDHSRGRWRDGTGAGHFGDRSKYVDTIRVGGVPLGGHREIRRGFKTLSYHKHVGHQKIDPVVPPDAQRRGKGTYLRRRRASGRRPVQRSRAA